MQQNQIHISVVSPVYKCSTCLVELCLRLVKTLEAISENFEIILVNDNSPDDSWGTIVSLSQKDKRVKGIKLSRNFGQHYAITAGLDHCSGEWIVVMDCDLQDQPEEIVKLYNKALEGYDVVYGRRISRKDNFIKVLMSKLFYFILSYLTGTKQDSSIANFGIYHIKVIKAILSMGDSLRYFPTMVRWVGFNQTSVNIEHAERKDGRSAYSFKRLINLSIDVMLAFSDKPLKLTVKLGLFISAISVLFAFVFFIQYLLGDIKVTGYTSLIISIWLLSGIIIL
jgi:polyisoprenyl-phosphate glycosyltransferase